MHRTHMRVIAAGFGTAISVAVLGAQQPRAPEPITDPLAYEVYAALLLPPPRGVDGSSTRRTLLIQEAVTHATCKHPGELNPEWKLVLEDFERQNARPRTLLRERLADSNVELIPRETLYARFPGLRQGEWRDYYAFFNAPLGSYGFMEVS